MFLSIEIYKKNNRIDLLEIEKGEVEIIRTFLPKQLNETEITKVCKETIQSIKAQGPKKRSSVTSQRSTASRSTPS